WLPARSVQPLSTPLKASPAASLTSVRSLTGVESEISPLWVATCGKVFASPALVGRFRPAAVNRWLYNEALSAVWNDDQDRSSSSPSLRLALFCKPACSSSTRSPLIVIVMALPSCRGGPGRVSRRAPDPCRPARPRAQSCEGRQNDGSDK